MAYFSADTNTMSLPFIRIIVFLNGDLRIYYIYLRNKHLGIISWNRKIFYNILFGEEYWSMSMLSS